MLSLGGGVALLHATKVLDELQAQNEDLKRGIEIVQHALRVCSFLWVFIIAFWGSSWPLVFLNQSIGFLQAPTFTIVSNAGYDGALVLGKLLEQDDRNLGYDAAKGALLSTVGKFLSPHILNT